jgi:MoaA/NifB/PqqE/SkfB family radical SAM enzyme
VNTVSSVHNAINSNYVPIPRRVDIIWNTTLICMWDCAVCCVDAVHVQRHKSEIVVLSGALQKRETFMHNPAIGSPFDQTLQRRQQRGEEATFQQKLDVLDNLRGFDAKVDFSGGDPLAVSETPKVMMRASELFGRHRVTLTATGAGLARCSPDEILPYIGELNFTYDHPGKRDTNHRPTGYTSGNFRMASRFAAVGVKTRAETPLTTQNIDDETLTTIYLDLHEAGIDRHLLMRLFPVGRGAFLTSDIPSADQYRRAISLLRGLEQKYERPKVKLQCALKFFDDPDLSTGNPCDLVRESFGLMADGTLLASPWAVGPRGKPLDDVWVLGNLATTPMEHILYGEKAQMYLRRANENSGHCKIHAYLASRNGNDMSNTDRPFSASDPLYADASRTEPAESQERHYLPLV